VTLLDQTVLSEFVIIPERGGGVLGEVATDKWVAGARRVWEACTNKYTGV
jgi:hypothetical protein